MAVGGGKDEDLALRAKRIAQRHPIGSRERVILYECIGEIEQLRRGMRDVTTGGDIERWLNEHDIGLVPWQKAKLRVL